MRLPHCYTLCLVASYLALQCKWAATAPTEKQERSIGNGQDPSPLTPCPLIQSEEFSNMHISNEETVAQSEQRKNRKYRHRSKERHGRRRSRKNKGGRRRNRKPLSLELSNEDFIPLQPPTVHEHRHFEKQQLVKNKTLKLLNSLVGGASRILAGNHELGVNHNTRQTLNDHLHHIYADANSTSSWNKSGTDQSGTVASSSEAVSSQTDYLVIDPVSSQVSHRVDVHGNHTRKKNNAYYSDSYEDYGSEVQPSWFGLSSMNSFDPSSSGGFVASVETKGEEGLLSRFGSSLSHFLGFGDEHQPDAPSAGFKILDADMLSEEEVPDLWDTDYDFFDSLLYDGSGSGERSDDVSEWSPWSSCNATCGEGVQIRNRSCGKNCVETVRSPCWGQDCANQSYKEMTNKDPCEHWMNCRDKLQVLSVKVNNLPSCPCYYPTAIFYDDKVWDEAHQQYVRWRDVSGEGEKLSVYKPGAQYCIRSLLTQGSSSLAAQHCCYDRQRSLITRGSGAGTPNLVSPEVSALLHEKVDLLPWKLCKGDFTRYNKIRPPNNENNCTENPDNEEYRRQVEATKFY